MTIQVYRWLSESGPANSYEIYDWIWENCPKNTNDSVSNMAQTIAKSPLFRRVGTATAGRVATTAGKKRVGVWAANDWDEAVEEYAIKIVNLVSLMRYDSLPKPFLNAANAKADEIREGFMLCP